MMMEEMVGEAGGLDSMAAMMFGKAYPSTPQPPMLLGHLTALKVKLWRLLLGRGGGLASGERGFTPGQWPVASGLLQLTSAAMKSTPCMMSVGFRTLAYS